MKDLTIAITNVYNDTVTMLPVVGELPLGNKAMFHNNPLVDFNGRDIVRNFDYHFDFALKQNRFHKDLLPNHYFHFPRLKRMTQYINIYHFNQAYQDSHEPIFIPEFYTATQRSGEHVTMANFSLPQGEKVVIKEQFGARGSNQVVVPSNMVTTLLKHTKGLTMAEVKAKFPDLIYSDGTTWDKVMFEKPADLFISQLVPSVKNEWRLLVGGDKIYGRERTIKQGPYPQANLDHDVFVTVPEVKYELIEEMFSKELVATLHSLVDFIRLPIGSIDLFLTEDGRYGIFEYSTQFAFMGADNNFIRQMLLDGLWRVISHHTPTDILFGLRSESDDDSVDFEEREDIMTVTLPETYQETVQGLDEITPEGGFVVQWETDESKNTSKKMTVLMDKVKEVYSEFLHSMVKVSLVTPDTVPVASGVLSITYKQDLKVFEIPAEDMSLTVTFSDKKFVLMLEKKNLTLDEFVKMKLFTMQEGDDIKTFEYVYKKLVDLVDDIAVSL